jgi:hypothetical protein
MHDKLKSSFLNYGKRLGYYSNEHLLTEIVEKPDALWRDGVFLSGHHF